MRSDIIHVGLEITSKCNLSCAMCGHAVMKREKADMPWDRFIYIVDEIKKEGHELRSIQWFGEPLLAENFIDSIEYLAKNNIPISNAFYTNGTLLTPQLTDKLLDAGFTAVCSKTKKIWIGLDSMNPETYRKLRCGWPDEKYEETLENIQYFCDNVHLTGIGIQRLVTNLNQDEPIEPFKRFGVHVHTRKVGRHWDKSRDLCVVPFTKDRRKACREHWGTLYIAQDGRCTSCCIDGELEHCLGNIDDTTITQLYDNRYEQQVAFNEAHKTGDYSKFSMCDRCTGMEPEGI